MRRFMELSAVKDLVRSDLNAVDAVIRARMKSDVELVDQVAEHIISGGGKRLRPLIVVLAARACGYTGSSHIDASAFIEFIHTATLLHDDVVDGSSRRRGRDTANSVYGNQASVLVGDFVYSRAFQMMAAIGSQRVMEIMAEATNVIAEGEVLQLMNCHDPDTDEARYLQVIRFKTAKLFEAAARLGAILCHAPARVQEAAASFGRHLGTAFQLVDDVLDYSGDTAEIGKNVGDDLREGKPTLPLIHVMSHGSSTDRQLIRTAIEQGGEVEFDQVVAAIRRSGSLDYARQMALNEAELARTAARTMLQHAESGEFSAMVMSLPGLAVERAN
jgi:octaprenyl-diphosphate synthase